MSGRPFRAALRRRPRSTHRASDAFAARLAWIFGSPRSGSTWLLAMLGEHSSIVPINEPLIGYYFGPFLCDTPGFDSSQLDGTNFTMRRLEAGRDDQFFAESYRDAWEPRLRELLLARFYAHMRAVKPDVPPERAIVAIKEPHGSQSADLLMRVLPTSRLLFLLRDGRDVVDSELAAIANGGWVTDAWPGAPGLRERDRLAFVVQCAKKWAWCTEVTQQAYAAHPGPKLLLRYEDLRAAPSAHLRRVLEWLELPVSATESRAIVDKHAFEHIPEESRGESSFFRFATPGLWRENLKPDEQRAVDAAAGDTLRAFGYDD